MKLKWCVKWRQERISLNWVFMEMSENIDWTTPASFLASNFGEHFPTSRRLHMGSLFLDVCPHPTPQRDCLFLILCSQLRYYVLRGLLKQCSLSGLQAVSTFWPSFSNNCVGVSFLLLLWDIISVRARASAWVSAVSSAPRPHWLTHSGIQ